MAAPLVYDGKLVVGYAPTIADPESPSAATDLASLVDLSSYIRKDGVSFPSNRNMVDTNSIDSTFDTEYPGTKGGAIQVTFKRKNSDGDEVAWTTFKDGLVEGFLVFGFEGSNTAASDVVDEYQIVSHYPVRSNPSANTEQTFVVTFGVQAEYIGVTVAA